MTKQSLGTYVNTEGRAQQTFAAITPPGEAREDWKIIRALSEVLGEKLPYDKISEVRQRMSEVAPNLTRYGNVEEANFFNLSVKMAAAGAKGLVSEAPISVERQELEDFYLTNSISRASPTMARCVTAVKEQKQKASFKS